MRYHSDISFLFPSHFSPLTMRRDTALADFGESVLPQHIPFIDNVGAEEMATRIQTDTREDEQRLFASGADEPIGFGSTY